MLKFPRVSEVKIPRCKMHRNEMRSLSLRSWRVVKMKKISKVRSDLLLFTFMPFIFLSSMDKSDKSIIYDKSLPTEITPCGNK